MENESLKPSEKKPEKKEDPFARLRGHLKQSTRGMELRKDLFFVLDASGSMNSSCENGKSKEAAVREVVDNVLKEYAGRVNMNLVSFNTDAKLLSDLSLYNSFGGTNIEAGLFEVLPHSQVVLLSDGGETCGSARKRIPWLVENAVTVHCIGVGIDHSGEMLLKEIADKTGGFYAGIDANFSQIFETFKKLASKAVAALTVGGSNA